MSVALLLGHRRKHLILFMLLYHCRCKSAPQAENLFRFFVASIHPSKWMDLLSLDDSKSFLKNYFFYHFYLNCGCSYFQDQMSRVLTVA